jgi:hypothetical protein
MPKPREARIEGDQQADEESRPRAADKVQGEGFDSPGEEFGEDAGDGPAEHAGQSGDFADQVKPQFFEKGVPSCREKGKEGKSLVVPTGIEPVFSA